VRAPFRIVIGRLGVALPVAVVTLLAVAVAASAAVPTWLTYDHDSGRSATDPDSTSPLTPTPAWTAPAHLDGDIYAQPLVYGSRVYVATENDTLYSLDAATGAVAWARHVGTAVPAADLPCGDISPTVGITSTPVIDPFSGRIYAVADYLVAGAVHHQLVALDLATGDPVPGFPIAVDPLGANPTELLNRAALALDGGRVIVPYGGNSGDCGEYHGWLVSAATDGTGSTTSFEVDPNPGDHGGAIWGAGDGPSQDAAGHLFAATGNGFSSASTPDLQESVIELDPNLNVLDHWTASNWKYLDRTDADIGSSEPLPLPDGLLFQTGKDNVGRLLDAGALGATGQVFSAQVCDSGGAFGAPLYQEGIIYVPCAHGIVALSLATSPTPSFRPLPGWTTTPGASGPPVLAGGLVWSTGWRSTDKLYGLDPTTGAIAFQTSVGTFDHFATPSAGGGRLFVAAGSRVSALTIANFPPDSTTTPTAPPAAGSAVTPPPRPTPPRLTGVRLRSRRFSARKGTLLTFILSEPASVIVQVKRIRTGRFVHRRCRLGPRRGRRCTIARRARRIELRGRSGHNRFSLRLRRLPLGRYAASIVALNAAQQRSKTAHVRFRIIKPHHRKAK
jgi:outer membrane protein assembly factor BamB